MGSTDTSGQDPYAFTRDRQAEEQRLVRQSQLLDPVTEELLRRAGLGPGMHVVDLGAGPGDTALLAGRLVGPTGSVLGVERSPEQVATARKRIAGLGIDNVTFREGDIAGLGDILGEHPVPVDAVIGRLILMWVPARLDVLRTCAAALPPGALVFVVDIDIEYDFAVPASPLWQDVERWIREALRSLGAETRMGPNLYRAFLEAGLPAPTLDTRTIMGGAADAPVWFFVNVVRAFLPVLTELGIVTAEEVGIGTLEDRLRAELTDNGAVAIVPPLTGAWTRIPG
jgi:ubiquinone/menaquinone biosynthesis C-methylase UbiE